MEFVPGALDLIARLAAREDQGHVQNLPVLGLDPPAPTRIADLRAIGQDGKPRAELWGLAWHSPTAFPGLAYCLGGARSSSAAGRPNSSTRRPVAGPIKKTPLRRISPEPRLLLFY